MPFKVLRRFGKKRVEDWEEPLPEFENVSSVIKNRRSVRKYSKKEVSNELIIEILESAGYAPSCGNHQPWEFIVIKDSKTKKDLIEAAYNQDWMLEAPVFIVACINNRLAGAVYGERGLRLYGVQSVGAAIENILLIARSLGLGSCWVGAFSEIRVAAILQCPDYVRPCAIITIGYPAEEPTMPPRQPMDEYVHEEVFGKTMQQKKVEKEKRPTHMKFR